MKTNEIIAALRYCQLSQHTDCWGCPANIGGSGCLDALHKDAADALESQQKRIEELEGYEKAEVNGTLLRLPCPLGSRIYILSRCKGGGGHIYSQTLVGAHLRDEHSRRYLRRKEYIVVRGNEGFSNHLDMDKRGIVWFTDYAAAKTALEVNT